MVRKTQPGKLSSLQGRMALLAAMTSTPGHCFPKALREISSFSPAKVHWNSVMALERNADTRTISAGGKEGNRGISAIRWVDIIVGTC